MALWHDFAWENDRFELPMGSSDALAEAHQRNVIPTRFYSQGDFDFIVFSSRSTLASAVEAARKYILKRYDARAHLADSFEYEVRGYFTMKFLS